MGKKVNRKKRVINSIFSKTRKEISSIALNNIAETTQMEVKCPGRQVKNTKNMFLICGLLLR